MKVYSAGYTKHSKKPILRNLYRSYFYMNEAGDIAHAGAYSNITTEKNKTAYEVTTVLYCLLFDKKIDDLKRLKVLISLKVNFTILKVIVICVCGVT